MMVQGKSRYGISTTAAKHCAEGNNVFAKKVCMT